MHKCWNRRGERATATKKCTHAHAHAHKTHAERERERKKERKKERETDDKVKSCDSSSFRGWMTSVMCTLKFEANWRSLWMAVSMTRNMSPVAIAMGVV